MKKAYHIGFLPSIVKKHLLFICEYGNIHLDIDKSCDWAAYHWFAFQRARLRWDPRMCNAGLSPMSCRLNQLHGIATPVCPLVRNDVRTIVGCAG